MNCLGCNLANARLPILKVCESKTFVAIMDINPYSDGHIIILPRYHVEKMINLSDEEVIELKSIIKEVQLLLTQRLNIQDFSLEANEGSINDLNRHFHFHILPRNGTVNSDINKIYKELME